MSRLHPLGAARVAFLEGKIEATKGEPLIPSGLLQEERLHDLDETLLWQVWELVRSDLSLDEKDQRAVFHLLTAALVALRQGSTRLPLSGEPLETLLSSLGVVEEDREAIHDLLALQRQGPGQLFGFPGENKPLILQGSFLYLRKVHLLEERLGRSLLARLPEKRTEEDEVGSTVLALRESPPKYGGKTILLTDEQEAAVSRAVASPLTVISGGPGTGKTSIVVSILRALVREGLALDSIALAAPTGKAANRMEESILGSLRALPIPSEEDRALLEDCPKPMTLHRLLGFSPGMERFRHHEKNPLAHRMIIVDEASMIDIALMDRLLRSVHPEASLVLLGDADQLPSVEAGAVLRDLVPAQDSSQEDPRHGVAVRLRKSFRMDPNDPSGRAILELAHAINSGDLGGLGGAGELTERGAASEVAFDQVELLPGDQREAFLGRWYREGIRGHRGFEKGIRREWRWDGERFEDQEALRPLFDHFERLRILCVTRVESRGTGADAINASLHRRHLESLSLEAGLRFAPGEPVMMQRNDYERGLFNGDQGIVLRVRSKHGERHHFQAVFPRGEGFLVFPLESIASSLRHSWAMTVHKSQGSEFDSVAVILPLDDMPLLGREILYTALTRSRRSVVFVGSRDILEKAVGRRLTRHSGIAERLARPRGQGSLALT